eukprot:4501008-Prymnesium_polylepis.2
MHKPINSIISMFTRMTTAFCIIFTSKHRRFYPHKPWTAVQFLFGLEVELYFYTCWSSDAWTKGSRSPKKLAWNLMMSIGHFVGLFLDLVTNVSRNCVPAAPGFGATIGLLFAEGRAASRLQGCFCKAKGERLAELD